MTTKHEGTEEVTLKTEVQQKPIQKPRSWFKGLFLIIACAGIIIAGFALHQNLKLQTQIEEYREALSTQINQLKQDQNQAIDETTSKTSNFADKQTELQSKIDTLNEKINTALSQQKYDNQDWQLLKVRYYLDLAQINTHWTDNAATSTALLQQADNLLKDLNEPQLLTIRQAIAKELSELEAMTPLDTAGLLSQLDAAQTLVSQLTPKSILPQNTPTSESTPPSQSAWRGHLQDSLNALQKLVIIRRNDEDIRPIMSPLYESILRESIRLSLQQVQWAVLNRNQAVYQLGLKQALLNINRNFEIQSQPAISLIKQLDELQKITLTQEQTESAQALTLLNDLINKRSAP